MNCLNKGVSHLNELGLDERIKILLIQNNLYCTIDTIESVKSSDILMAIVPIPITKDKGPYLSYVISAAEDISKS